MIARRDLSVRLVERRDLSPTCFSLLLACPESVHVEPGQFGMLTCGSGIDPLLRRPFSIAGVHSAGGEATVELLVKEVGRGTGWLRRAPLGATLDLLLPLGRGFDLEAAATGRPALVAGGIGLPPVLFAAQRLAEGGACFDLFVGAVTAAELLVVDRCRATTEAVGGELILTTDDGSHGEAGFVTEALRRRHARGRRYQRVLACGPDPMLQAVAGWASEAGAVAELSLEEPMACGVGVCLGCVVELADGRRVASCKEGPVFEASRLAAHWRP